MLLKALSENDTQIIKDRKGAGLCTKEGCEEMGDSIVKSSRCHLSNSVIWGPQNPSPVE